MTLPSFYKRGSETKILGSLEEERKQKKEEQKNLKPEERKALFNSLANEDKKLCLVDLKKKCPLTPADIEDLWFDRNGKMLSEKYIQSAKANMANAMNVSTKYFSWKSKGDTLLLREYDAKFRETGKSFSQIQEKNNLAILIKGEKFPKDQGFVTFEAFRSLSSK